MNDFPEIIAITGPTASGKSSIAMELAKRLGGEIISGDSMQIYRGMDIGTAKPTASDMTEVKHHLIDMLDISEAFSVNDYCTIAKEAVEKVLSRNKLPIICGGTGQYIEWFLKGIKLTSVPSDMELRKKLEEEYDLSGAEAFHQRLVSVDKEAAALIHPNNKKRVVRALEIFYLTGKNKTFWDKESLKTSPPFQYKIFNLEHDRSILYERINKRVDIMRKQGLTEEVEKLWKLGIENTPTASQAIGYKEFFPFFKGEISEDEAYESVAQGTRNYAKRQITFFKRIDERINISLINKDFSEAIEEIIFSLKNNGL
ncbi:MAG: tRNA (adenosine(37)-N6)-dimethylallyltransferase MiaA [Clostridia bacterium]|nr:tRNA (adenosine(37)-N6)-dimethylallyltransferase MiaA [Clostridia bacterium]